MKRLEACLALWPEEDADPERLELVCKIAEVKKQMSGTKPIGAQLDAARAAAQRATNRLDEAEKVLQAAQMFRDAAASELTSYMQDVAALEAELTSHQDSFGGLQNQVAAVIAELKADAFTCPEHVKQAEAHVERLFTGLQHVMEHSIQARQSAAAPRT